MSTTRPRTGVPRESLDDARPFRADGEEAINPRPVKTTRERGGGESLKESLWARFDLLERDVDLRAIEGLLAMVPHGGGLLAIEGPPGIGKTSLISEAKARAQQADMQVLGARGSELERRPDQVVAVGEVPVEASLRRLQPPRQRVDRDAGKSVPRERRERRLSPVRS